MSICLTSSGSLKPFVQVASLTCVKLLTGSGLLKPFVQVASLNMGGWRTQSFVIQTESKLRQYQFKTLRAHKGAVMTTMGWVAALLTSSHVNIILHTYLHTCCSPPAPRHFQACPGWEGAWARLGAGGLEGPAPDLVADEIS